MQTQTVDDPLVDESFQFNALRVHFGKFIPRDISKNKIKEDPHFDKTLDKAMSAARKHR